MNYARAPPTNVGSFTFHFFPFLSMKTSTPTPVSTPAKSPAAIDAKVPVATFRHDDVSAAVFRETYADGTATYVSLRRSYRDASGAWQHTQTLTRGDLLAAAFALTKCYEYLATPAKTQAA